MDLISKYLSIFKIFFFICIISGSAKVLILGSQVLRPRGVSLEMASFYDPSDPSRSFTCFDGTGKFPFSYINDDYCDCKDGSDEPGTAACVNGVFHCTNNGHVGRDIASSFVNDGVCDCCDASDEYLSTAQCSDVCLAIGRVAREEAIRRAQMQMEGYQKRLKMAEDGARITKEKKERLVQLSDELEVAKTEQAQKTAEKDEAEVPEKKALEKYKAMEEELKAKNDALRQEERENEANKAFEELDLDKDGSISIQELQQNHIFDTNQDGEVSFEEAKIYLREGDSVSWEAFLTSTWNLIRPTYLSPAKPTQFTPPEAVVDEEPIEDIQKQPDVPDIDFDAESHDVEDSEEESDPTGEEEEEEEDYHDEAEQPGAAEEESPANEDKIEYDPETQALVDDANTARDSLRVVDDRVRDLSTEVQRLHDDIGKDFGAADEFRAIQDHCFEYSEREYVYKLCPFESAIQRPKSGGGETRLGNWGSWEGPPESPYSVMKYTGGQSCWNGPQRSVEVRLSCGLETALISVAEPSRCEYLFEFVTAALCSAPAGSNTHGQEGSHTDVHSEL